MPPSHRYPAGTMDTTAAPVPPATSPRAVSTPRWGTRGWGQSLARSAGPLAPGAAVAAAIAAAATALGGRFPVIGAPVLAIVAGIAISVFRPRSARLEPGLAFTGKHVLQGSITVLGLQLSLHQVITTGVSSLPVLLGTLIGALGMAWVVGRALRLRADLNILIGVGTAICGASAIAATDAVIGAAEVDVSYAIATIFTFNVVAVLAYPGLGHLLGLSQHAFGLWSGTAINDTSSVVAASTVYGHAATSYGVVVKLTRTLAIIPICLALAAWRHHRAAVGRPAAQHMALPDAVRLETAPAGVSRRGVPGVEMRRIFPLFILGFVAAVAINTAGLVPRGWAHPLSDLATWMITAALAAIGLSTQPRDIRRTGPRPLVLGAILWATVGGVSLALQSATGSL